MALLAIADLLRERLIRAGALTGIAFAVNAFLGIWMPAPLSAAAAWLFATKRAAGRVQTLSLTAVAFLVPAAPVAAWIALATSGVTVDFDYRAFLNSYYPHHFF